MQVLQDGAPVTDITPGSADPHTPGFAIEPAPSAAPRASLPGPWLQFMADGVALGDPDIAIVDIVSDASLVTVTRGVGENSHVITVKRPEATGPAPDPWFTDVILLWNMLDSITTAPPLDESIYAKTYAAYGAGTVYQTDFNDSPFVGGHCADQRNVGGDGDVPHRAFATDAAWDFNASLKTLTVEGWVKVSSVAGDGGSSTIRPMASGGQGDWIWPKFRYIGGVVRMQADIIGSQILNVSSGMAADAWFHYVMQLTGTTAWFAANGVRLGSYVLGTYTWNNLALQMTGTTTGGSTVGAGIFCGPHRVTLGHNRYDLDVNSTYVVPSVIFANF